MKPHPDDPRLSSYLLGELPPDEAAEVERALAADPALRVAVDELARLQQMLDDTLGGRQPRLHGWQREAVRRAAGDAGSDGRVVDLPSGERSWRALGVIAAAALVVLGVLWMMWRMPVGGSRDVAGGGRPAGPDWADPWVEIALLPMPGPAGDPVHPEGGAAGTLADPQLAASQEAALRDDPGGFLERVAETLDGSELPPPGVLALPPERRPVPAATTPVQPLPLIAGDLSYRWLRSAVVDRGELPPRAAVRVEELVNALACRLPGGIETAGVRVAAESAPCPWDDGCRLVVVTLGGAADGARRIEAAFEADAGLVGRFRLLGFGRGSAGGASAAPGPTAVPANHRVSVALQVWPVAGRHDRLGVVTGGVATAAGIERFEVPVDATAGWDDVSSDTRQVILMAGLGLWLGESGVRPAPSPRALGELAAAELAGGAATGERAIEALQLVVRAAGLAAE